MMTNTNSSLPTHTRNIRLFGMNRAEPTDCATAEDFAAATGAEPSDAHAAESGTPLHAAGRDWVWSPIQGVWVAVS